MKHLFWRIYVYFGVVLIVLVLLIGLVYTKLNRSNIIGVYETQLEVMAGNIGTEVKSSVAQKDPDGFYSYLSALEDFGEMQNTDIWIISDQDKQHAMSSDYCNIELENVKLPERTVDMIEAAFGGQENSYSDYDSIYEKTMLHFAKPIHNSAGNIMGVVVLNTAVEGQENVISQYQDYLFFSILVALLISLILVTVFTRQIVRPIMQMKKFALRLAAGSYTEKTDVARRDEIGALAHSLDVLSERLQDAEEMRENIEQNRRDFFSNVSHELRTPITVVKGYTETLADGYITEKEKQQEYYERILKECTGMERLVSDLLVLSKLQNPDFVIEKEVLNLIAVAQDVLRSMRVLLAEKQIEAELTYDDECSFILGDYDRIRQLFIILLQNAIKYSKPQTKIRVHIGKANGMIVATVADQGIGIAKENQEDIFEKFYRGNNHREKDGSGLGLVVGKGIVERHGGTISVESELEKGSTFTICIPETEFDGD